ncbi:MAG: LPS assembly lipoprotein LptE [Pseudomonadota bacterium]
MRAAIATKLFLAALSLALVAGCGYQLRTWDLEGSVETAKITSNPRNPVATPLGQALRSAGVELVDSGSADVSIELLDHRSGRRSISVTDQARAAEYEASLSVLYRVVDADGEELAPPRWVRGSRVYTVDRNNLVGSSEEQALLEREMVTDLVQQVIRGVNAVVDASASAA